VRVRVEREQGNVLFASIVEIITPSPVRIEPPCPYFGTCGGCDWQHASPALQLSIKTDLLWEFNFRLILLVRDLLGIETPLTFSRPAAPGLRGSDGIVSVIQAFRGPMEYFSGVGARSYMGDCHEFAEAGIPVIWSRHKPPTGDSILTILFDHDDPLGVVLSEADPQESKASIPRQWSANQEVLA